MLFAPEQATVSPKAKAPRVWVCLAGNRASKQATVEAVSAMVHEMTKIPSHAVLRYFDCWGRAQGIRDFLHDQGITFTDERIEKVEATDGRWLQRQVDKPATLNAFRALPVLEWGDQQIEQTEAISLFLTLETEFIAANDTANLVRHASVFSFAHQDLLLPMALFLWTPIFHPEKDIKVHTEQNAQLIEKRAPAISKYIEGATGDFLFGERPSIADCSLFNAGLAAELLFGERFTWGSKQVLDWKARMHERLSSHPKWKERPTDVSGSPVEDELREELRSKMR